MQDRSLEVRILSDVYEYVAALKEAERVKIRAQIALMREGDYSTLYTKQLSGPVRELMVKQHRILYFKKGDILYFTQAFKKQSAKTPKREIDRAKDIYKEAA